MKRYRSVMSIGDVFDDMARGFYEMDYLNPLRTNYSFRGQIVDTDRYELVEKKDYTEKRIKAKQEEIDALEREHESFENHFKVRKQKLEEEKESLLRARDNKSG
jgi:hypothetical protein